MAGDKDDERSYTGSLATSRFVAREFPMAGRQNLLHYMRLEQAKGERLKWFDSGSVGAKVQLGSHTATIF